MEHDYDSPCCDGDVATINRPVRRSHLAEYLHKPVRSRAYTESDTQAKKKRIEKRRAKKGYR